MFFDIAPPTYSYLQGGLLGGMIGALLGLLIHNNSLRWLITFSIVGMISSAMFASLGKLGPVRVYSEIKFFIPTFIIIGGLIGELVRRKEGFNNWRWIPTFSLLGAIGASISQIRGQLFILTVSLVLGAVVWQVTNTKIRWTLAFTSFGAMLSWMLLSDDFSTRLSFDGTITVFVLGGIVAAIIGWSIDDTKTRWILTLTMVGAMCGSMLNWFSNSTPLTLFVGLMIGGAIALAIIPLKIRGLLAFMCFTALNLCWIAISWHIIRIWERMSPIL